QPPREVDLELAHSSPSTQQWTGGQLEAAVEWDLARIAGKVRKWHPHQVELHTHRLRFVPIWDDEAGALADFLTRHRATMLAIAR
ncbi:MAG: hypothetical protein ABI743_06875, partial [bacterium]